MKDSFSPTLDENCGDNEVFLPDNDEERRTFKQECEATDALVQIGGMLLNVVQILRDCHEMRQRHIYGWSAALVRPSPKPNAKRKLTFQVYNVFTIILLDFLQIAFLFNVNTGRRFKTSLYY